MNEDTDNSRTAFVGRDRKNTLIPPRPKTANLHDETPAVTRRGTFVDKTSKAQSVRDAVIEEVNEEDDQQLASIEQQMLGHNLPTAAETETPTPDFYPTP